VSRNPAHRTHGSPLPAVSEGATPLSDEAPALEPEAAERQAPVPSLPDRESRSARFARTAHSARLHVYAFLALAVLVYVVALGASNTRRVKVDWVFGRSSVSLVWLVLFAAVLGWMLGIMISALFRWRTRAPRGS
jgi:uncharacterized integral membrane protein